MVAILWSWRFGTLEAQRFDDLGSALRSAFMAEEDGTSIAESVELEDGTIYRGDELVRMVQKSPRKSPATARGIAADIHVKHPTRDRWASVEILWDGDDVVLAEQRYADMFGADRVKVIHFASR